MTEKMRKTIDRVLEETIEPISNLSIADLCVVKGIKFNPLSERFLVYLDLQRMAFITSTFFFVVGKVQVEDIISDAMRIVFPSCDIRYFYVGKPGGESMPGISR